MIVAGDVAVVGTAARSLAMLWLSLLATVVAQVAYGPPLTNLHLARASAAVAALLTISWLVAARWQERMRPWRGETTLSVGSTVPGIVAATAGGALLAQRVVTPEAAEWMAWANLALVAVASAAILPHMILRPRALVIGDLQFCFEASRLAACAGRVVVGSIEVGGAGGSIPVIPERWLDRTAAFDELVVGGAHFELVHQIPSELRTRAARFLVVDARTQAGHRVGLRNPIPFAGRAFKRALDLTLGPLMLLAASPVILAALVVIAVDSPGSPIFRQERVGVDGRSFTVYKLRTMRRNNNDAEHREYVETLIRGQAQSNGGLHKLVNDRRITRVGRTLRRLSVDELPQLWNVICGDMTLVGPRPALPSEMELYDMRSFERLRVKPGLTGLWQVNGRCELDFRQMVNLDIHYWQTWSLLGDLAILARTPWAVVTGRGAA